MSTQNGPASSLARRLRELREHAWPDISLTQRDLARALGGRRPLSVPLISSWENTQRPTVPPAERLLAYATFFASRRSATTQPYRLLPDTEFTDDERDRRDTLERELLDARAEAVIDVDAAAGRRVATSRPANPLGGPWRFADGKPVTIVCAEVPPDQQKNLASPDDPNLAYAELYSYADLDALLELHGHIRAANPTIDVTIRKAPDLEPDDYTTHLVFLGGVDWNREAINLLGRTAVPITQYSAGRYDSEYRTIGDENPQAFKPEYSDDHKLLTDVGHFVRAPNPFNHRRTLSVCNGFDSRGVLGTIRALTDERFRERNGAYIENQFADVDTYSILTRIQIVDGAVLTPDWTLPTTRLHEWKGNVSNS